MTLFKKSLLALSIAIVPVLSPMGSLYATDATDNPEIIVIGHRGASGFRPEHTIRSYRQAILQGADFIEPDLVPTKDGRLIARHENDLTMTTDVSDRPEFADRQTTKFIDGVAFTGWFSEDFTLAEIKTLRARERIPGIRPDNTRFDDRLQVPTLEEILRLVNEFEANRGMKIGIYPETKHPTYFQSEGKFLDCAPINMSLGKMLIDTLVNEGFTDPKRIFIQSFEFENLIELQKVIMPSAGVDLPLVQLYGDITDGSIQPGSNFSRPYDMIFNAANGNDLTAIYGPLASLVDITDTTGYGDLVSEEVIQSIADMYAEGIGPGKDSFLLREPLEEPVDLNGDGVAQVGARLTGEIHPLLSRAIVSTSLHSEGRGRLPDAAGK